MKERGMLFSPPMVRALLDGSKTQTRRILKDTGLYAIDASIHGMEVATRELDRLAMNSPYGQPGDRLWVRETFHDNSAIFEEGKNQSAYYRADYKPGAYDTVLRWHPSIHMPRWASRIDLEITGVRVERLNSISEKDAIAEGIARPEDMSDTTLEALDVYTTGAERSAFNALNQPIRQYRRLWESLAGPGSWDANPWVWVIEFRMVKP